jgi:tRNA(fMet)-specific endonuclease VapC
MMKVYLLDTNFTSALWDGLNPHHETARTFLSGLGDSIIYISRLVEAEILYGHKVHESSDPARRKQIEETMRAFPLVREIDQHTTNPYSDIRAALFKQFAPRDKKGKLKKLRPESLVDNTTSKELEIQENDLWMASIAVQHKMFLVTEDKMKRIKEVWPALELVTWKPASPTS